MKTIEAMTDTPITDAMVVLPSGYDNNVVHHQDLVRLCRDLERKRTLLYEQVDILERKLDSATALLTRADDMLSRADIMLDGWAQAVEWHNDYETFKA